MIKAKKINRILFMMTISLHSFLLLNVSGQTSGVGTTAGSFLEIAAGTRGAAMGNAYVAVADGPEGAYWNPAAIGMMKSSQVSFMEMDYVAGIEMQSFSFAIPIPEIISLGVMITNISVPDDIVRTVDEPDGTGETFGAGNFALNVLAARQFTDRFSLGIGFKFIQEKLYQETASALAIDFGVLYKTAFLNNMVVGMSITNFGTDLQFGGQDLFRTHTDRPRLGGNQNLPVNYETDSWPLPITFRFGVAMNVLEFEKQSLLVAVDALHPNNINEYVNIGTEYVNEVGSYGKIALRAGYNALFQEDSQQGLTLGGGLDIFVSPDFSVMFDYAFTEYKFFNDIHRYTVSMKF